MKSKLIYILFIICISGCKKATTKNDTELAQETQNNPVEVSMDTNAANFLKDSSVTALSIGIYKDDKTYIKHYGEIDRSKGNPPNDKTLFKIASITKTLTGTLAAQAVLDGKLNLDDDIRKYLDGDYKNLEYEGQPILIKHILTHTASLPSNNKGINELSRKNEDSLSFKFAEVEGKYSKDLYFNYLKEITLDTVPGTRYRYSNLGANLMGHILETTYEKSFSTLLDEFVFKKAGMTNTKMNLNEEEHSRLANGYDHKGNLMPHFPMPIKLWGAAGALKSSMPDLIKYMQFQLDNSNAVVQESHKKIYQEDDDEWVGYFWRVDENKEGAFYHHHGGMFGANTYFYVYPEYKMGIAVTTNVGGGRAASVLGEVADGLLDDLKPFGEKSISRAISNVCFEDVDKGIQYYHQLKKENLNGYNFSNENELNVLGYRLLRKGKIKAAIKVFTLLVAEFPEASNPYDSLGEGYFEDKNYELSLLNYKKSLVLNPENDNAKMMIERINNISRK